MLQHKLYKHVLLIPFVFSISIYAVTNIGNIYRCKHKYTDAGCILEFTHIWLKHIFNFIIIRKEGRKCFINDTLNTFYLRLYGVGHMVKDHSDSERGDLLPPQGLLFPINSKGSFICTIPQTG